MYPIYGIVREKQEHWYTEHKIGPAVFINVVVQPRPPTYFTEEAGDGERCHARE